MDLDAESEPADLRELRILVLHNRDFDSDEPPDPESKEGDNPRDLEQVSRADVANAAQNVARALVARGHFVEIQGIDSDDTGELIARLRQDQPDLVFNMCESLAGESRHEAFVPALLDVLGISYTGSGALCIGLCNQKFLINQVLHSASIPTPMAALLPAAPRPRTEDLVSAQAIGYPLCLKLASGSGSLGISNKSVVGNDEDFIHQIEFLRDRYRVPLIAERFVEGRELCAAVLGNAPRRLLPLREIDLSGLPSDMPRILNERSKWDPASTEYQATPSMAAAPMPKALQARIEEVATRTFAALDLWDYGRCDIRLSSHGIPYVIDVNPNCDLSDSAGYARAGLLAGFSYDRLIEQIAFAAIKRNAHVHAQRQGAPSGAFNHPPRPSKRSATAA
jgi:D-alanine-D-alanine ligase